MVRIDLPTGRPADCGLAVADVVKSHGIFPKMAANRTRLVDVFRLKV